MQGGKEFVAISRKNLGGGQQGLLYFGFFPETDIGMKALDT